MNKKAIFFLLLRIGLASIIIVSGYQKLTAPYQNFVVVIEKFAILNGAPAHWIAWTLPWVEFVVGVLFALGLWTRASLFVLWAMNTGFIGILSLSLIRKLDIQSCGCFGEAVSLTVPQILSIDIATWCLFLLFFIASHRAKAPALDHVYGGNV